MTINWKHIAKRLGYNDIREYVIFNYYLDEKSANACALECGVDHQSFKNMMEAENFPRREKGWVGKREFVCKHCNRIFVNKKGGKNKRTVTLLKPQSLEEKQEKFILTDNF